MQGIWGPLQMAPHQGHSLHLCDQEQHFEVFTVRRLARFPPQRAEEREFFSPHLSVSDSLILTILGIGFLLFPPVARFHLQALHSSPVSHQAVQLEGPQV